jgi:hypothetical protein
MGAARSPDRPASPDRVAPIGGLDVYLLPAVVGGGWGDITEVLDAGRTLQRAGFLPTLYRAADRPLPRSVDGPWDWDGIVRRSTIAPTHARALTISANWGVSAAPDRPGRLGRGGVWSVEAERIERSYGPRRTIHVSLEEFARTLTSREENQERWREGGESSRRVARRRTGAAFRRDTQEFHDAFRLFRGFDLPNVLHLFQGFEPAPPFVREFPEAVEIGPLWPLERPTHRRASPRRSRDAWVWYASPSTSDRLVRPIDRGLSRSPVRVVRIRSPRPLVLPSMSAVRWSLEAPMAPASWNRRFEGAALRIVTGSRTLLEALAVGGPFLYYNGVLGQGRRSHRHRPEKIRSLLSAWKADGVSQRLRRDLADFSRGRRVEPIVRAAAADEAWGRGFPHRWRPSAYPTDRRDGGRFLVAVARSFASEGMGSEELVGSIRAGRSVPSLDVL